MVTEGPFRFSRNPMYLGMLLIILGAAVKAGFAEGFAFAFVFFLVANFWYIPFEEKNMEDMFGDTFEDYKKTVRRWI